MKRLIRVLERHFYHVTKKDWDAVILISGEEGGGKSTLALHIYDWYLNKLVGECKPEDIKNVTLEGKGYIKALMEIKKKAPLLFDEAGEISNRRSMGAFNFVITQAYQVIRGMNLFTILCVPSIFELDKFFTGRRARALIHLDGRGRFKYYNRNKLRHIINRWERTGIKKLNVTRPLFPDTCPKYHGVLAEQYATLKDKKMKECLTNLHSKYVKGEDKEKKENIRNELIIKMKEKLPTDEIAKITGLSSRTIQHITATAKRQKISSNMG